ncbi:uncharacterized protein LOC131876734 [Cryptomeria japonica]|uniref:uncharacterized protein LOC131876734 n=1 Tax=Cryptomeria japonica TaxID=3369 RepID=UPI0027DA091E|nr:uncharacterized protein LOC131876734 [Cryptomeria japonica]
MGPYSPQGLKKRGLWSAGRPGAGAKGLVVRGWRGNGVGAASLVLAEDGRHLGDAGSGGPLGGAAVAAGPRPVVTAGGGGQAVAAGLYTGGTLFEMAVAELGRPVGQTARPAGTAGGDGGCSRGGAVGGQRGATGRLAGEAGAWCWRRWG